MEPLRKNIQLCFHGPILFSFGIMVMAFQQGFAEGITECGKFRVKADFDIAPSSVKIKAMITREMQVDPLTSDLEVTYDKEKGQESVSDRM